MHSENKHQPKAEVTQAPADNSPYIAGIGASAGGLEALSLLVSRLPRDINCAFVILQHLSPNYRSMLVQLIGRETNLAVVAIENDMKLKPGCIYVAPPRWDVIISKQKLQLVEPQPDIAPKPSVNRFLHSLATEHSERAIGVILSGTGTDGAAGIRAIKASGGATFAQNPDSAKYAGMPRAAIETVSVDFVQSPNGIAHEISHYVQLAPKIRVASHIADTDAKRYEQLIKRVYEHTKVDFSGYKESTVWRRIERRMATTRCSDVEAYLVYAEKDPAELDALCKDILISVTEFFRDRSAFNSLRHRIRELLERKNPGDEIRIWVAGCATGEEAYSIAIMLADSLGAATRQYDIQIFATDIDMEALNVARRGLYSPASLTGAPMHYLSNYFEPNGDQLEVIPEIREMLIFARQDLVLDPPFLRLDLVSCRNVLIYFNQELQATVLSVIRYGLSDGGVLFLGRSENISQAEEYFTVVDAKNRIFTTLPKAPTKRIGSAIKSRLGVLATQPPPQKQTTAMLATELAAKAYIPPSVLIDSRFTILQSIGDIHDYVHFPEGVPQLDLSAMMDKQLRQELFTLIHFVRSKNQPSRGYPRRLAPGPKGLIRLSVHPYHPKESDEKFLVSFEIVKRRRRGKKKDSGEEAVAARSILEDELTATQEHLQTVIEELETSNEEMQALNEEIQAANEELQASNEELEASNEELQSSNEELVTLNAELLIKSAELSKLNLEFENVNNNINFPIVVLNADLVISRFNKAAHEVLNLKATSLTKPFSTIKLPEPLKDLPNIAENVLATKSFAIEVLDTKEQYFLLNAHYFESDNAISGGVILTLFDQTKIRVAEKKATDNEEKLLALMNHSPSIISMKDIHGHYTFVNQKFMEFFKLNLTDVLGKGDHQLFNEPLAKQLREHDLETLKELTALDSEEQIELDGQTYYLSSTRYPIIDENNNVTAICTQAVDSTTERTSRLRLELAANVFANAGEGIVVTDERANVISVNRAFEEITGYSEEMIKGKSMRVMRSEHHDQAFYDDLWNIVTTEGHWQGEIWNKRPDGVSYPTWLTIKTIKTSDNSHGLQYVGLFTDVSSIKKNEERVQHLATHDVLTDLPNRALFTDRLAQAIIRSSRLNTQSYVLFIDLDNFKFINDNLGHSAGDDLLREAANRIQKLIRGTDTVSRWGGDEFVVILESIDHERVTTITKGIIAALSREFDLSGRKVFITASIGICSYPLDGQDANSLLRNADTAMYKAKDSGKNQFQFFSSDLRLIVERRLEVETGIRQGIAHNEFRMTYQPEWDLKSGRCIAFEALIRWQNSDLGVVTPDVFIPVAEESDLIEQLTEQSLRMVLSTIRDLRSQGIELPKIFINFSSKALKSESLRNLLKTQLEIFGIPTDAIGIEITETALLTDNNQTLANLNYMRRHNIDIYVDDFGTGYSSLAFLKRYPIDGIKIDKTFVDGLVTQADDQALVSAIIGIAHSLGMAVLAEGVETQEQHEALLGRGCHQAQGYLFSRPLEVEQLSSFLRKQNIH